MVVAPLDIFRSILGNAHSDPEAIIRSGAVNTIFVFTKDGKKQVLRVRTGESNFLYEKGFFKELLLAHFLASASPGLDHAAHNQAVLEKALEAAKNGSIPTHANDLIPKPLEVGRFSDGETSFPWMIQEFAEGSLIAQTQDRNAWVALGRKIAGLHSFKLTSAGRFDAEVRDLSFNAHIEGVLSEIKTRSPIPLRRTFELEASKDTCFSLCHNDLHCLNVLGESVIDWDNASISAPMQDLAKLKRWTRLNEDGYLSPDENNFAAFLEGYSSVSQEALDQQLLELYELLFLCRAYNFEQGREKAGRKPAPPLPPSHAYVERISELSRG